MYIGTIINSLIIIIILHLLICNFKKFRLYENLDNILDDGSGSNLVNNIGSNLVNNIGSNLVNNIEGIPEYLLNKKDGLIYSDLNENTNNIVKKYPKKELLNLNHENIRPSYSTNLQNYDNNFNNQNSLREINKEYDNNCDKEDISQYYNSNKSVNDCFEKNIKKYYEKQNIPEINEEIDIYNNRNINIPKNLIQSNNNCSYSTSEDIHLMDNSDFSKYSENNSVNLLNNTNLNPTEPCPHNATNTFENKKEIDEKPMHGGLIGNYVGFNNYDDEYATFKNLF